MNRREFLECAALLVAGVSAAQAGIHLSEEQRVHLAAQPDYASRQGTLFNEAEKRALASLCETIIPRTDTPGAIDAGVPRFVELMVQEWFTAAEREVFLSGFADLQASAAAQYANTLEALPNEDRQALLEALEEAASDSAWYGMRGESMAQSKDGVPFICQLKEMTVFGFFTSEVGSTQVLRYKAMPMYFDGKVELEEGESAWASGIFPEVLG